MGQQTIIHLNGKQYDAITGELLSESRIKATPEKRQAHAAQSKGKTLDGVVRRAPTDTSPAAPRHHTVSRTTTVKPASHAGKKTDVIRPQPKHARAHPTERSKTLVRRTVAKPRHSLKPAIKTTNPSELAARPVSDIASPLEKKLSVTQVNPVRLSHAQHIPKSHHIKRFDTAHSPAQKQVKRDISAAAIAKPHEHNRQQPRANSPDIFEAALARATSHQQAQPSKTKTRHAQPHRRLISVMAGIAAFLVIGGFVTYLNMPGIELRVASVKAGFSANMPGYKPTGYALKGGIESTENHIAMNFNSGDSTFKVTQAASDWNSQTLLDAYTERFGSPERTIQRQGRTIYMYDNGQAAWVNGGIRYELTGNASLTADDIASVATSM